MNKLYLLCLRHVLNNVQRVLKAYQSENADQAKLLDDLIQHVHMLSKKVTLPTARVDPLTSPITDYVHPKSHLGYEFEKLCATIPPETEKIV